MAHRSMGKKQGDHRIVETPCSYVSCSLCLTHGRVWEKTKKVAAARIPFVKPNFILLLLIHLLYCVLARCSDVHLTPSKNSRTSTNIISDNNTSIFSARTLHLSASVHPSPPFYYLTIDDSRRCMKTGIPVSKAVECCTHKQAPPETVRW